jgi:hypothetical protein
MKKVALQDQYIIGNPLFITLVSPPSQGMKIINQGLQAMSQLKY